MEPQTTDQGSAGPTARRSLHIEPVGLPATARHYIRDLVYGANDGIITTFAVVSGASGGAVAATAVLIIGVANLTADGMSMGVGNLLSIRAHERVRAAQELPGRGAYPWEHGAATLLAFVRAGANPLCPFLFPAAWGDAALWSRTLTFLHCSLIGAGRATLYSQRWWQARTGTLRVGRPLGGRGV